MTKVKENGVKQSAAALKEAKQEALLDAEAKESPVLSLIAKRIRAARKKVKKAEEIEAIKASGKDINADQEESLRVKGKNAASIEELERLFPQLKEAVAVEVAAKLAATRAEIETAAAAAAVSQAAAEAKTVAEAHEVEKSTAAALAEDLKAKVEQAAQERAGDEARFAVEREQQAAKLAETQAAGKASTEEALSRLLQLFYFSTLFSKTGSPNDYIVEMERDACLSYDSNLDPVEEALTGQDLDAISSFAKMIITRPMTDRISHETVLERAMGLVQDWVHASETRIPNLRITVDELVAKFERITRSGFYTIQPDIQNVPAPRISAPPSQAEKPRLGSPSRELNGRFPSAFGHVNGGPPLPQHHGSNTNILHLMGQGQVPQERQASSEQIAFMQPLSANFSQQSSGTLPATAGFQLPPVSHQPPGFEPQKPVYQPQRAGSNDVNSLASQFLPPNNQRYAPPGSKTEPAPPAPAPAPQQGFQPSTDSTNPTNGQTSQPSTAASQEVLAPAAGGNSGGRHGGQPGGQPESSGSKLDGGEALPGERKGPYSNGQRPRASSSDGFRGRSAPRGRGGRQGDFAQRSGGPGRRGGAGPGRGYRGGRGRGEYSQTQVPQPINPAPSY